MMKTQILFIVLTTGALLFVSCKKCKTCQCWKSGVESKETNCAYGFPPTTSSLDVWEDYLTEESGYDSVQCVLE